MSADTVCHVQGCTVDTQMTPSHGSFVPTIQSMLFKCPSGRNPVLVWVAWRTRCDQTLNSVTMHSALTPPFDPQLQSAVSAVEGGTPVVIANGTKGGEVILDVLRGRPVGTLVTSNGDSEIIESAEQLAESGKHSWPEMGSGGHNTPPSARRGSQTLQALTSDQRASILRKLAALLVEREEDIITANKRDLEAATELSPPLRSRLSLSSEKLASVAKGLHKLAGTSRYCIVSDVYNSRGFFPEGVVSCDVVGEEVERVKVGEGLELVCRKVPLGVILVVFESRPDCLPQVRGHLSHVCSRLHYPCSYDMETLICNIVQWLM